MSKYTPLIDYYEDDPITKYLKEEEQILFEVKPKKNAYMLNQSLSLFPIAMIWISFDSFFIFNLLVTGVFFSMAWFFIPFFGLHLLPFWLWLKNVLTASKSWNNTSYIFTNKRILIQSSKTGVHFQSVSYSRIKAVEIHTGLIDHFLNVKDIYIDASGKKAPILLDLENADEVYYNLTQILDKTD